MPNGSQAKANPQKLAYFILGKRTDTHIFLFGVFLHFVAIFALLKLEMEMITIVGTLAAILTTSAMFPQAIKIIRSRDVRSISLIMYIANALGVVLWLTYGILLGNAILIITNIVAFIPAVTILILKIKLNNKSSQVESVSLES